MTAHALTPSLLQQIDAYWRAANYLSVGRIFLCDNPVLKRPLALRDVKRMLPGHWGTPPLIGVRQLVGDRPKKAWQCYTPW